MATCRYCNQNADFLRKQHRQCRDLHTTGIQEMTQLAAQAARTAGFNETSLRNTLWAIATRARATEDEISQAIAAGWTQGVQHAMHDGILTREEETDLRSFRDRMADQDLPGVITASATLDRVAADRIAAQARHTPPSRPPTAGPPPSGSGQRPPPGQHIEHSPPATPGPRLGSRRRGHPRGWPALP